MPDERLFPATIMPDKNWWHALWPDPESVLRAVGFDLETVIDVGPYHYGVVFRMPTGSEHSGARRLQL